jgi:squalene-hopene/tetraprenyl-beta-curcumene cyclase
VVTALAESHLKMRERDGSHIQKAVDFVLSYKQADGGIYNPQAGLANYNTSISILMLAALENPKYRSIIDDAQRHVAGIQRTTNPKSDNMAGGMGYTKDKTRPDLSNTHWAIEALKAAEKAGSKVDPAVYERVQVFLKRCQNDAEVSDMVEAAVVNDSGFIYRPGDSKAGQVTIRGRTGWRSYGSMTYAGFKAYIHAGVSKDDPAVQGAWKWISKNYTLDENPGMTKKFQGYYYYFVVFAKGLAAFGRRHVTDELGVRHDWAAECAQKLLSLQKDDGRWENAEDRWYEGDPALVTAYAILALNVCREQLRAR